MLARVQELTAPAREKLAPVLTVVSSKAAVVIAQLSEKMELVTPIATKVFHYGAGPPARPAKDRCVHAAARARMHCPPPFHPTRSAAGFIPLVILLGMRSQPRPRLVDLLTPM